MVAWLWDLIGPPCSNVNSHLKDIYISINPTYQMMFYGWFSKLPYTLEKTI